MIMKRQKIKKRKRKERWSNRITLIGITFVVLSMVVVVQFRSSSLKLKEMEYTAKKESLDQEYAREELRARELEEQRVYIQTKQYIEEVAKEKLGLVHPDEILLKPVD